MPIYFEVPSPTLQPGYRFDNEREREQIAIEKESKFGGD